jgi:hypothetical protein
MGPRVFIGIALSCAALSVAIPVLVINVHSEAWVVEAFALFQGGWLVATAYALIKYRWRGAWCLLGSPPFILALWTVVNPSYM